jgi:Fe(3+) dicitrate transport protein
VLIPSLVSLLAAGHLYMATPSVPTSVKTKHRLGDTIKLEAIDVLERGANEARISRLPAVGVGVVYAAKKTERVVVSDIPTVTATNTARQAFASVAGINVWESDPAGLQLSIGARGLNPNRMINFTARQNGYDISADPLGYPESYYTPLLEAVDHIDVVRGSGALRYGSQFGGTINFVMKEGARNTPLEAQATATVGSFGLKSGYIQLGGTSGASNYIGIFQHRGATAWRANSSFNQNFGYAAFTQQLAPALRLKVDATTMQYLAQQPGGLTDSMFLADPRSSSRSRNWLAINWNMASATIDWRAAPRMRVRSITFVNASSRVSVGNVAKITIADNAGVRTVIDDTYLNLGNETTVRIDDSLSTMPFSLLGGLRLYKGSSTRKQGNGSSGSGPDVTFVNPSQLEGFDYSYPSTNAALFSEMVLQVTPALKIVPGVRFENISTSANGTYRLATTDSAGTAQYTFPTEELDRTRNVLLAGLGVSYSLDEAGMELYANATQNYRAVNFSDLRITSPTLVVDPSIRDASGYTIDLGMRGSVSAWLDYDASLFAIEYRDRIGEINKTDQAGKTYRLRTNLSNAYSRGIEWVQELHVSKLLGWGEQSAAIDWLVNASLLQSRYQSSAIASIDGKQLEYAPAVNLRTGLSAAWKFLKVSLLYSHVGKQYADATNAEFDVSAATGVIPSYDVVDLMLSASIDRLRLNVGINNLLDARYYTRRADGFPGPGIIPAEPLTVNASISVTL